MRMLIEFRKGDVIRHLGLLDLQRTMQRALRRSGLPIAYSNGFNPHIVMAFASALSSGIPGDAEILDVTLTEPVDEAEALERLWRALPPALAPNRVRLLPDGFPKLGKLLRYAGYRFTLAPEGAEVVMEALPAFLAREEIMALRKSKTRETLVNIRPMIQLLEPTGACEMNAIVSFTEEATLKPDLLMEALLSHCAQEGLSWRVRRTGLYAEIGGEPVSLMEVPA